MPSHAPQPYRVRKPARVLICTEVPIVGSGLRIRGGIMRRSLTNLAALAMAVTLTQSGCALLMAKGPPENHAELTDFGCTESARTVVLDVAWGVPVTGVMALGMAMGGPEENRLATGVLMVGAPAALALTSIFVGSDRIMRCREALDALEERRRAAQRPPDGIRRTLPDGFVPWIPVGSGWNPLPTNARGSPGGGER